MFIHQILIKTYAINISQVMEDTVSKRISVIFALVKVIVI